MREEGCRYSVPRPSMPQCSRVVDILVYLHLGQDGQLYKMPGNHKLLVTQHSYTMWQIVCTNLTQRESGYVEAKRMLSRNWHRLA